LIISLFPHIGGYMWLVQFAI